MSIRHYLHRFCKYLHRGPGARRPRKLPRRLELETLEDRAVPTVMFNPHFGQETITDHGGTKLNSPPVYLIFWGSYWQSGAGAQMAANIQSQTANLLSGPYLSGLKQYGVDGHAQLARVVFDGSNPQAGFSDQQIKDVFNSQIDNNHLPESDDTRTAPIYVVLTPPNLSSNTPGAGGYHGVDTDTDLVTIFPFPIVEVDHMAYAWVGGFGGTTSSQLDSYMGALSHEVAETITDPMIDTFFKQGITSTQPGFPSSQGNTEIGDWEPDGNLYNYRVNGVMVQAYYSKADQAFIVPDGNSQKFFLDPIWNADNSFTGTYNLRVQGDQVGINDVIALDVSSAGGVAVNLNGEAAQFDPGVIKAVNVFTGNGNDIVNVQRTLAGVPTTINLGSGTDIVNVGLFNRLQHAGTVVVNGQGGNDALNINDRSTDTFQTYTITRNSVSRTGGGVAPVFYSGIGSLVVNSGTAFGIVNVESTGAARTTINAGPALTFINVSPTAHNLNSITGKLAVNGNANTRLTVSDQAHQPFGPPVGPPDQYLLTSTNLTRVGFDMLPVSGGGFISIPRVSSIDYSGVGNLVVNTTNLSNLAVAQVNVESTAGGTRTTINAGAVPTFVLVSPTAENLNTIAGALAVNGNASTTLIVNDQVHLPAGPPDQFTLTSTNLTRFAQTLDFINGRPVPVSHVASIDYGNVGALVVNPTISFVALVNVLSTAAGTKTTFNAGTGTDVISVGNAAHSLDGVLGPLTFNGGGNAVLTVNDQEAASVHGYLLTASTLDRSGAAKITYTGMKTLAVNMANGSSGFEVLGLPASTAVGVKGGSNTALIGLLPTANTWRLTALNAGTLDSTLTFSSVANLLGGNVSDTFVFSNGAGVSGVLRSTNANHNITLDYSAYTTPVAVNLTTFTATGIQGGIDSSVQKVIGGSGTNLLVGGPGKDTLVGGSGRSVLIGGAGDATLVAGSGEAVLIGGATAFDRDVNALNHVMAEWARANATYQQRVDHLINGGGLNGLFRLNAGTVHAGGHDTLTSGPGLDLLFLSALDRLTNPLRPGERLVNV
jgi:hypothetical protein